jgi:hypothetical protein
MYKIAANAAIFLHLTYKEVAPKGVLIFPKLIDKLNWQRNHKSCTHAHFTLNIYYTSQIVNL